MDNKLFEAIKETVLEVAKERKIRNGNKFVISSVSECLSLPDNCVAFKHVDLDQDKTVTVLFRQSINDPVTSLYLKDSKTGTISSDKSTIRILDVCDIEALQALNLNKIVKMSTAVEVVALYPNLSTKDLLSISNAIIKPLNVFRALLDPKNPVTVLGLVNKKLILQLNEV